MGSNDREPEIEKMAFQTGSSIIYVLILHNIVIPAVNMGVSSTSST